jgi:calmodulin
MKAFAEELKVSMADLRQLMVLADENDDGLIEYREFVPLATELLALVYAKLRHEAQQAERASAAVDDSVNFLLNGMGREELEESFRTMFREADTDGSGYLDRKEFGAALRQSDLGLTKKQIRLLMEEADANGDGRVSYTEFIPLAFSLLAEMVAKQLEYEQLPADEAAAANYLESLFADYDVDGSGRIALPALKRAFRDSDIGLTSLQLRALLGLARADEGGEVDYHDFAVKAASMVAAIVAVQTDSDMAAKVVAARAGASALTILGLDRLAFRDMLAGSMAAVDATGSGRGSLADVRGVLVSLGLDERTTGALLNLAREGGVDDAGNVELAFVAEYAFDTLAQLQQLEALASY